MVEALSILLLLYCAIPVSAVNYFIYCHPVFGSLKFTEQCTLSIKQYFMSLLGKSNQGSIHFWQISLIFQCIASTIHTFIDSGTDWRNAYEQESCLAEGEGAHPCFASRCRCPLHHPRKQENLSSLTSAGSAAKGFWGKLVYSCLPACRPGLHLSCGLWHLTPKTSRLIRCCQAVTPGRLWHRCRCSCGHGHFCQHGPWQGLYLGEHQEEPGESCSGSGPCFCCCPLISWLESGTKYSSDLELCCKHNMRKQWQALGQPWIWTPATASLLVLYCQHALPIPARAGLSWASYKRVKSGKCGRPGPSTPTVALR